MIGGSTHRRLWLLPVFAMLSLALAVPAWTQTDWGSWYISYSGLSWWGFYLGICFLGLFAWESANAIRGKSTRLLLLFCLGFAIATVVTEILFPIRMDHYFFSIARLPFFIIFLVEIILIWNLLLMPRSHGKAPLRTNIIAALVIVSILSFFLPLVLAEFFNLFTGDYGQMVSFFILVLPTVLVWEGLLDSSRSDRGVLNVCALVLVSGFSMYLAVALGSAAWVT
jgi:hypothetical protein